MEGATYVKPAGSIAAEEPKTFILKPCNHILSQEFLNIVYTGIDVDEERALCPECQSVIQNYQENVPASAHAVAAVALPNLAPPPVSIVLPKVPALPLPKTLPPFQGSSAPLECTIHWVEKWQEGHPLRCMQLTDNSENNPFFPLLSFWGYSDGSVGITLHSTQEHKEAAQAYLAFFNYAFENQNQEDDTPIFFAESHLQVTWALNLLDKHYVIPDAQRPILVCFRRCLAEKKLWWDIEKEMKLLKQA